MDDRDRQLAEEISLLSDSIETKQKYRKITQAAIAAWVKGFQDGSVQVKTVDDLRKLIKIDSELKQLIQEEMDQIKLRKQRLF
jgi:hypothetical protein